MDYGDNNSDGVLSKLTYTVIISSSSWYLCQLYLVQNYFVSPRDYTYRHTHRGYEIVFYGLPRYQQFVRRWAAQLL
jgi:hypothetical protein